MYYTDTCFVCAVPALWTLHTAMGLPRRSRGQLHSENHIVCSDQVWATCPLGPRHGDPLHIHSEVVSPVNNDHSNLFTNITYNLLELILNYCKLTLCLFSFSRTVLHQISYTNTEYLITCCCYIKTHTDGPPEFILYMNIGIKLDKIWYEVDTPQDFIFINRRNNIFLPIL
jgi:hypothetical protein